MRVGCSCREVSCEFGACDAPRFGAAAAYRRVSCLRGDPERRLRRSPPDLPSDTPRSVDARDGSRVAARHSVAPVPYFVAFRSPAVHSRGKQYTSDRRTHREDDPARCHRLPLQPELLDDEVSPEILSEFGRGDRGHPEHAHRERGDRSGLPLRAARRERAKVKAVAGVDESVAKRGGSA